MSERQRFGLTHYPLPKNAEGKSCYDKSPGYARFARSFQQLLDEPGLGVLTSEAGVGKTTAMRNVCMALPRPDYLVLYFCDTTVSPLDLYRSLAGELGVKPSHRRGQLWADIKSAVACCSVWEQRRGSVRGGALPLRAPEARGRRARW